MMKRLYSLLFILYSVVTLNGQSTISKMHCFKNLNVSVQSISTFTNEETVISGTIYGAGQSYLNPDIFLARLAPNGNIIWIKKIIPPCKKPTTYVNILSNNNIILSFEPFSISENSFTYAFDKDANIIWSKQNLQIVNIIDLPQEQAFINDYYAKIKYNGDVVWSKNPNYIGSDYTYQVKASKYDDKNYFIAIGIGELTTTNGRLDSIGIIKININDGSINSQHIIYGSKKDTLLLSAMTTVNKNIIIGGTTGLSFNATDIDKCRGFITNINENQNIVWAKKMSGGIGKKYFSVDNLFSSKNNELLGIAQSGSDNDKNATNPIMKFNLQTGKVDKNILYNSINNNFHVNSNTSAIASGKFVGVNYFRPEQILNNANCQTLRDSMSSKDLGLKITKSYSLVMNDFDLGLSSAPILEITDLVPKTYDNCPECGCPQLVNTSKKICEGTFYKTKSGKKIYTAGLVIDTSSNIINGCLRFEEITLGINVTSKITKDFIICKSTPSIKIASKTYTKSGTYQDTLKSKTGCDSILTIRIKDLSDLSVNLGEDKEVLEGDKVTLEAKTNYPDVIKNYVWLPQGTNTCDTCRKIDISPSKNQWYAIKVSKDGCSASDSINVKVLNQKLVYMPNIFSPNGDKINDLYRPYCAEGVAEIEYFQVFDRWGTLIYDVTNYNATDTTIGWDGTYKNIPANRDVYTYAVQVRLRNGQTQRYLGDVFLQRE
jgi:gliding motility-associated-like protein